MSNTKRQLLSAVAVGLSLLFCLASVAAPADYQHLRRVPLPVGASSVSCLVEDRDGLLWIGTTRGVYAYDGYTTYDHRNGDVAIRCGLCCDGQRILFGTERGLLVYDYRTDSYGTAPSNVPPAVNAIAAMRDTIWLASATGLYRYGLGSRRAEAVTTDSLPSGSESADALCVVDDTTLYVGTHAGLLRYESHSGRLHEVALRGVAVRTLLADTARSLLWIGTADGLHAMPLAGGPLRQTTHIDSDIAALALDASGSLIAATSVGLVVDTQTVVRHDARDASSLPNDDVRCLLRSATGNVWIGTADGLAGLAMDREMPFTPIWQLTGTGLGNRFDIITADSHGRLWMGGPGGLISTAPSAVQPTTTVWYRVGDASHPIAGNHVHGIHEADDGTIWIATDGGVERLVGTHWQAVTAADNAEVTFDGANSVVTDADGRLWIATTDGRLLVAPTPTASPTAPATTPLVAIDTTSLPYAPQWQTLARDNDGHIWAAGHGGVRCYAAPDSIVALSMPEGQIDDAAQLLVDDAGRVWLGSRGGVLCWPDVESKPLRYAYTGFGSSQTTGMAQVGRTVWVTTTDGVWTIHPDHDTPRRLRDMGHRYHSIHYDAATDMITMGATDGLTHARPDDLRRSVNPRPVQLMAIDVNGERRYTNGWTSVRYGQYLGFGATENNLVFHISDLPYDRTSHVRFIYRLAGRDKEWSALPEGVSVIACNKLKPANYWLQVGQMGSNGEFVQSLNLPFKVYPHWYASWWAFVLYFFLLCAVGVALLYLLLMRSHIRIERNEKLRTLEQSREKMQMYVDMSDDFKQPLAQIARPLDEYMSTVPADADGRGLIEQAQEGVVRLTGMVNHMLNYDKIENNDSPLMLDEVDVVDIAKRVYDEFAAGAFARNGLTSTWATDIASCIQLADTIKIVAAVTGVMSNAARYTPRGGHIEVRLTATDASLTLTVTDDGIGIPKRDLPHVTEQHFQGSNVPTRSKKAGMGLYYTHLYIELHGGTFAIDSRLGQGTTVTITIPRQTP